MRRPSRNSAGLVSLTVGKPDPMVLQDFIARRFSVSRRAAKALIDGRNAWVNRNCVWMAGYRLRVGDAIEIPQRAVDAVKRRAERGAVARQGDFGKPRPAVKSHVRILWQNDDYLVCDKPSGMLSCGAAGSVEEVLREQESLPLRQVGGGA